MNEREFGAWLRNSLDGQQVPLRLASKIRAGRRPRSTTRNFGGAVAATLAILLIAAIAFGVRALHFKTWTAAPSPRPTQTISATPSAQANATCQLPLSILLAQGQPPTQEPGFLTYPEGSFNVDNSVRAAPTIWSWDAPMHRWVPTLQRNLSPDGRNYIDASTTDTISIVNVASGGVTRVINGGVSGILGWANQGIVYFSQTGTKRSLKLVDPQTSASRTLTIPVLLPQGRVFGNALWLTGVNSSSVPILVRLDLTSGDSSLRFTFTEPPQSHGGLPKLLGFDDLGNPVIVDAPSGFSSPYQLLLATGIQKATSIYSGQAGSPFRPAQQAIGDPHGVWMLGTDGTIWLYDAVQGLRPIPLPGDRTVAELGGPCQ